MILVTGATGFLGAELITQLTAQNLKVRALKRTTSSIPDLLRENKLVEWFVADINEPESLEDAFENITQVYHCAAFISFDPKDKAKLLKINIEGTSNIVNLCAEHQARLVHVSSIAALGNAKKGEQITEKDFWEYDSKVHAYAISKYEGEMEVWRGIAEGLNAVIVNPAVIIGKNAGFEGSGAIFKLVKDGLKFYTDGATGIVDVEDVAKAMILLMNSEVFAERYTLSADNLNYKDFFAEIATGFGIKPPKTEAKPWMLGIAWRAAKLASLFTQKAPALTQDAARSSFNLSYYSNAKVKNAININFKPLKESILEVCQALK
ncbi:NAD-dependent epimerase/dehydratase family protein [Pedobacter sp. LMG 31464]|uniref:NAD-dependent epimerase/dehydratase family protein n=1 Tax=Pedobacter planticolens TaxID=2679964 RepID=A0A923DYW4_9SPHI|nr:NAD-dependent epimerase/dehydratase family protein [Pedobacter planticolens]MBB2146612.1 NAD-dependent epimerase/dehydratase family protein [Pedobacter planticolens]